MSATQQNNIKGEAETHKKISFLAAVMEAHKEEMERDKNVILLGEDIAVYGGGALIDTFGDERVMNTPISENGFTGLSIGAAITGLRPIVDLQISSFLYLASDQIINQASKLRYMTGGQLKVPVVFRTCVYYDKGLAAQHSDRPYPLFMNTPGLKIIAPSTPSDMKGMLKSAIRDDDPVIVFEDASLWAKKELVSTDPDFLIPLGKADIKREGTDITVVPIAGCLPIALAAAKVLEDEGISVEVVDPRTLAPMDTDTIVQSVAKTGRLVIMENSHLTCSIASEIAATVVEQGFDSLRKPIRRLTVPMVHIPFSPALEKPLYPTKDDLIVTIKQLM